MDHVAMLVDDRSDLIHDILRHLPGDAVSAGAV